MVLNKNEILSLLKKYFLATQKYKVNYNFNFIQNFMVDYNVKFFDDVMYQIYRKKIWNEYELVFIKGNRNIILV